MLSQTDMFHYLLHSAHLLEECLRSRLAPLGVQPRQARVLDALGQMGPVSQVKLARELALTAASMSTMTARLLAAGLIEKQIDERELRSNVLTLSRRGQRMLNEIHRQWRAVDQEIYDLIGAENASQLKSLTCQLRDALGGSTPGSEN